MTAKALADTLEVTKRTVYRDIAALQAQRVPIEGEAGVGYILRPGFELPPLMFTSEEIEAISVGLALLRRTGDGGLLDAAESVARKVKDVLPKDDGDGLDDPALYVSGWNEIPDSKVDPEMMRTAIRDELVLVISYSDAKGRSSQRTILPLAVVYYIDALVVAAWCEVRDDYRHFRIDRIQSCAFAGRDFAGQGRGLRAAWEMLEDW